MWILSNFRRTRQRTFSPAREANKRSKEEGQKLRHFAQMWYDYPLEFGGKIEFCSHCPYVVRSERGYCLGIIDSLSAGYRFLGRNLHLLLIPVVMDLLLWLGPRFSVASLFSRLAEFYAGAADLEGMPRDVVSMSEQISGMLTEFGANSNLLDAMVSRSLLHVPSLLATIGPIANGTIFNVANPFAAFLFYGSFGVLGVLIGVVYLNLLASKLPLGSGSKLLNTPEFVVTVIRQWFLIVIYVILLALLLLAISLPVSAGALLITLISPVLGSVFVFLLSGTVLVLFFYLYFVTAALIMDDLPLHLAVVRSFTLVRNNFLPTLGFIILTSIISVGMALILDGLTTFTPVGVLAAIVINAYVGSGLAMALLVFYRTRVLSPVNQTVDRAGVG